MAQVFMVFLSNVHKTQADPCSYQWVEPGSEPDLKLDQEGEGWRLVMGECFCGQLPLAGYINQRLGLFQGLENKWRWSLIHFLL